ncbi:MAG: sulfotransferase family 2 domain-containing protein, partial [Gammaproteobacteria bacterium]
MNTAPAFIHANNNTFMNIFKTWGRNIRRQENRTPDLTGTSKRDIHRQENRTPDLTGTWMTQSENAIYRSLPKCGCTTIGQILYYTDNGHFYNGNVHHSSTGIHRWTTADPQTRAQIQRKIMEQHIFTFSCVRNPYTRVLSCFFDKICNVQARGKYYHSHILRLPMQRYGIDLQAMDDTSELDQIKLFRRFLLFARDTVHWLKPGAADPHWQPMYRQLA